MGLQHIYLAISIISVVLAMLCILNINGEKGKWYIFTFLFLIIALGFSIAYRDIQDTLDETESREKTQEEKESGEHVYEETAVAFGWLVLQGISYYDSIEQ